MIRPHSARQIIWNKGSLDPSTYSTSTLPQFNSSPLKSYLPNRKVVFQLPTISNHHFAEAMLNFGGVFQPSILVSCLLKSRPNIISATEKRPAKCQSPVNQHLLTVVLLICAMVKSRYIGDGHPTFNDGILIMGPYKPLRNWVDEFIPYYMEIMGVYTMAHITNP